MGGSCVDTLVEKNLKELVDKLLPATGGMLFPCLRDLVLEFSGEEIGLSGVDELASGSDLVAGVENSEEDQTDVGDEEVLSFPGDERSETLGDGDDGTESYTVDGERTAAPRLEGESVAVDVLGLESAHKGNVADQDTGPGDETSDGDNVEEPVESLLTVGAEVHVGEQTHGGGDGSGPVWHSALAGGFEECGGALLLGKTNENSASGVDIGAGCRKHDSEENGVENVGESGDTGELEGNDHGRGAGVGVTDLKGLVVVRDQDADEEDGEDEKDEDAPEGLANGFGHSYTRVGGLSCTDSAELSTLVGETGLDEDSPETNKFGNSSFGKVRSKSTRGVPVLEANVALVTNTSVHADGVNPEADQSHDLDEREPKFEFAKDVDRQEVNGSNRDPEDGDEDSDAEFVIPPLDDETGGSEFERVGNGPGKPVNPSHGETERGVDESSSILGESTGDREVGGHLSQAEHDRVDQGTDENIGQERSSRTSGSN